MPTAVEITRVDPHDDALFDAWWDAYAEAKHADMGSDALLWSRRESRIEQQHPTPTLDRHLYVAIADGEVVGASTLELYQSDNRHAAGLGITVPPSTVPPAARWRSMATATWPRTRRSSCRPTTSGGASRRAAEEGRCARRARHAVAA